MPDPEMQDFDLSEPFGSRPLGFVERVEFDRWELKLYAVRYGEVPLNRAIFDEAIALSRWVLPRPARTKRRPGLGFLIAHQGRDVDYFLVNWWDKENELYNRVLTRRQVDDAEWQAGTAGEMACVWDLEIIWHERNAYIRHMMRATGPPDRASYLDDVI